MLKRISFILLTILLVVSFAACDFAGMGGDTTPSATTGDPQTGTLDPSALQVHYIDCGQADSILILAPTGESMLIDAGDNENSSRDAVVAYLKNKGIDQLDWLVLTHPHADHIGGAAKVLTEIGADKVLMPDKVHTTKLYAGVLDAIQDTNATLVTISDKTAEQTELYEEGMDPQVVAAGSSIELGEADLRILGPVTYNYGSNMNNYSVILRMEYGAHSFLFTGDAEVLAEEDALEHFGVSAFRCNVLKSGHHGSDTSSAQALINATGASIAVISVGEGNDYGHPCAVTLNRYEAAGMRIYRTDLVGTVVLQTTGSVLSVVGESVVNTDVTSASTTDSSASSSTEPSPSQPASDLRVHAIPCGAGEAFLVTAPDGKQMLIDTGSNSNASREAVQAYLRAQGVTELEWLVLTNTNENHIGGAAMVLTSFTVNNVLMPNRTHSSKIFGNVAEELLEKAGSIYAVGENDKDGLSANGITPQILAVGSSISLGEDVTIEILGPTKYLSSAKQGETSVVLRVIYGTTAFLFTGNISDVVETSLLETYLAEGLSANVLKLANHGAITSNASSFIAAVSPDIAILSASEAADAILLERLSDADVTLYQTFVDGVIVIKSDGTSVIRITEAA